MEEKTVRSRPPRILKTRDYLAYRSDKFFDGLPPYKNTKSLQSHHSTSSLLLLSLIPTFQDFLVYVNVQTTQQDSYSNKCRTMAGVGRRTHYRKHLTDSVLNDFPVPTETERIAKVVATRGGNHFEILLASSSGQQDDLSLDERKSVLAMLPTKFRKLVWLKRNDFVIVDTGEIDDDTEDNTDADAVAAAAAITGIRYIISHILYKDQVRNLQVKGLWPVNDSEFGEQGMEEDEDAAADYTAEDGIVYDTGMQEDDDIFLNTNRTGPAPVPDSSDSEDDG